MSYNPVITLVDNSGVPISGANPLPISEVSVAPTTFAKLFRDSTVTVQASAAVSAPTAGTVVVSVTIPTTGLWEITAVAGISGTVAAGDTDNMQLRQNITPRLSPMLVPGVANAVSPPLTMVLNCAATNTVSINTIADATATASYAGVVTARQVG